MSIKQSVIAHRGASGYLPEHSMESKAMAYAMGADFIEQDVVMSKDNQLLVLHDHFLDNVSNVADCFPQRAREDGHFYVIDFTLEEIQSLNMCELFEFKNATKVACYAQRFPLDKGQFKVHTLQQEIELIQGLNKSTGNNVGIYCEIKSPFFHQQHGKDIALAIISTLKEYGYHDKQQKVFLQSFDKTCLQRIKNELLPAFNISLPLVQLIAETNWMETAYLLDGKIQNYDYDWMYESGAMQKIAHYADAIGPWFPRLLNTTMQPPFYQVNRITLEAHQAGLLVHPYTFRREPQTLPTYIKNFEHLLHIFLNEVKVDAVFTDFPDIVVKYLQTHR